MYIELNCIWDGSVTDPEISFKVWDGICCTHTTRQDQDGFPCPVAVSFFQVGVLWSSAIFGVWTLCRPVARFYFPAVQWVPASQTFGDSRHPGQGSPLLGLRSWWSELTYTMSFGLNISMAAFSCYVCHVMFLDLKQTRNFIPFDSDKVCMGWTWYLGSLAATQTKSHCFRWLGCLVIETHIRQCEIDKEMIWFSLCSEVMLGESLNESLSSVELDVVFFWVSCRILEAFTSMCKVNGAVHPRPWCRSTTGGKNWAGCCCCYLTARKVPEVGQERSQRNDDSYCVMVCSCGHARHFLRCLTGLSMGVTAWLIARYHLSPYVFDGHYTERLASSFFSGFESVDFERWVCFNKAFWKHSYHLFIVQYRTHIFFARGFSDRAMELLRSLTKACKPLRKWNAMPCGLPRHDEIHNCTTLTHFVRFSLSLSLSLSPSTLSPLSLHTHTYIIILYVLIYIIKIIIYTHKAHTHM